MPGWRLAGGLTVWRPAWGPGMRLQQLLLEPAQRGCILQPRFIAAAKPAAHRRRARCGTCWAARPSSAWSSRSRATAACTSRTSRSSW